MAKRARAVTGRTRGVQGEGEQGVLDLLRGGARCYRPGDRPKVPQPLGVFVTWSRVAVARF